MNIPTYPEEIEYLWDWVQELHGRSGIGFGGIAPLTYSTIESWQRLKGIEELEPLEVEALVILDLAMQQREESQEKSHDGEPESKRKKIAWPKRKT